MVQQTPNYYLLVTTSDYTMYLSKKKPVVMIVPVVRGLAWTVTGLHLPLGRDDTSLPPLIHPIL